jgi:hypothetical protein
MLHQSAREHYEKLQRVVGRIDQAVHKDDLDDFFKTAYHLIEITERDPATTPSQKATASALKKDADMRVCRDICNGQKHFTLNPKLNPNPVVASASTRQGYGVGGYGKGGFGVGEQSVTINLSDGTTRDAHDLVRAIATKWAGIF